MRRICCLPESEGEIHEFSSNFDVASELLALCKLVQVADLIMRSAQGKHEIRGRHSSQYGQYPTPDVNQCEK